MNTMRPTEYPGLFGYCPCKLSAETLYTRAEIVIDADLTDSSAWAVDFRRRLYGALIRRAQLMEVENV
jgi:hypothetical protein